MTKTEIVERLKRLWESEAALAKDEPDEPDCRYNREHAEALAEAIALIEGETPSEDEARKWLLCDHPNRARTGGNDYIRCDECGFGWDYRRGHDPRQHAIDAYRSAVRAPLEREIALLREDITRLQVELDTRGER